MTKSQRPFSTFWKACLVALLAAAVVPGSLLAHGHAFGHSGFVEDRVDEPLDAGLVGEPDITIAYVGEDAVRW